MTASPSPAAAAISRVAGFSGCGREWNMVQAGRLARMFADHRRGLLGAEASPYTKLLAFFWNGTGWIWHGLMRDDPIPSTKASRVPHIAIYGGGRH